MSIVKCDESLQNIGVVERLKGPGRKQREGVGRIGDVFEQLPRPPQVRLQVLLVLCIHGVHLPGNGIGGKQGGGEELSKAVQGSFKVGTVHIEVVVCLLSEGEGVVTSPVGREVT